MVGVGYVGHGLGGPTRMFGTLRNRAVSAGRVLLPPPVVDFRILMSRGHGGSSDHSTILSHRIGYGGCRRAYGFGMVMYWVWAGASAVG